MIVLDKHTTALVLLDLQKGILAMPLAPLSGAELLARGKELAGRFRDAGGLVILVNVAWSTDNGDFLDPPTDQVFHARGSHGPDFSDLADGLAQPGDLRITKRQMGAFTGTDLDVQLRRRGIRTVVLAGVATNMAVESTARHANELNYAVVIANEATTSISAEMHEFAITKFLPRIARIADRVSLS